ncbi:MAG: hypothetical protein N2689_12775, partial [Verrucomicrobiae bacterium]|nr:hypothetical protein [Verrucomicrobiae bacterium]
VGSEMCIRDSNSMERFKPSLNLLIAAVIIVAAVWLLDRWHQGRQNQLRAEMQKQFVADLTAALEKALPNAAQPDASVPPVGLIWHTNLMPKGSGQIEIFNLSSTPAYVDSSGTRVTGEIMNDTPRHFGLLVVSLVAIDKKGKILRRQPILFPGLAAQERRAFETTLNLPLEAFAAHRFELDVAR